MESFTQHYKDMQIENVLDEGLFSGLWKLMNTDIVTLIKSIKPKTIKLKNLNKIKPNDVDEVNESLFSYASRVLSTDLLAWKKKSRDAKWVNKFLMKKKDLYVVSLVNVILDENLSEEFADIFDLTSDKFLINSFSLYKTSNKGSIGLISISDPYVGDLTVHQVPTKKVGKLQKKLKNLKFFLIVDKKGEAYFTEKFGMVYKQFIIARSNVSKSEVDADTKAMQTTYEETPEEPSKETDNKSKPNVGGTTKVIPLPDGRKIKLNYQLKISGDEFNKYGYSAQPTNFKTKLKSIIDNIKPFDTDRIKGKIYTLKDGGQVTLFHDKNKDTHFIVADKAGENAMAKYDI